MRPCPCRCPGGTAGPGRRPRPLRADGGASRTAVSPRVGRPPVRGPGPPHRRTAPRTVPSHGAGPRPGTAPPTAPGRFKLPAGSGTRAGRHPTARAGPPARAAGARSSARPVGHPCAMPCPRRRAGSAAGPDRSPRPLRTDGGAGRAPRAPRSPECAEPGPRVSVCGPWPPHRWTAPRAAPSRGTGPRPGIAPPATPAPGTVLAAGTVLVPGSVPAPGRTGHPTARHLPGGHGHRHNPRPGPLGTRSERRRNAVPPARARAVVASPSHQAVAVPRYGPEEP